MWRGVPASNRVWGGGVWCALRLSKLARGLRRSSHRQNIAQIPDDQRRVPVINPPDQIRAVQAYAETRQSDGHDLGSCDCNARTQMHERTNEGTGFGDAEL